MLEVCKIASLSPSFKRFNVAYCNNFRAILTITNYSIAHNILWGKGNVILNNYEGRRQVYHGVNNVFDSIEMCYQDILCQSIGTQYGVISNRQ